MPLLPSFESLQVPNLRAVSLGYPLFTVGALFAGLIWARRTWGSFWDPKGISSVIIWLFYTVHPDACYRHGCKGARAAWLSVIGFALIVLSFAADVLLGGQHTFG